MEHAFYVLVLSWLAVTTWFAVKAWRRFVEFVSPAVPGQASPLGKFIEAASQVIATQVMLSVKGSLMGHASAISKAEQGMEQDIVGDTLAAKAPLLGLVLEAFPSLRKRVTKSSVARMALANLNLDSLIGGKKNGHESEASQSAPQFKL